MIGRKHKMKERRNWTEIEIKALGIKIGLSSRGSSRVDKAL